jgi:putative Holliday junction resolvase
MQVWLGVDYGSKRVGVAVGNTKDRISSPLSVLPARPQNHLFDAIRRLAENHGATGVVVGLPINMDETEGPQAVAAREFAARLGEATGRIVRLWDERLSSFQADRALAGHLTRVKRRRRQDALAAAEILGAFLRHDAETTP